MRLDRTSESARFAHVPCLEITCVLVGVGAVYSYSSNMLNASAGGASPVEEAEACRAVASRGGRYRADFSQRVQFTVQVDTNGRLR